MAEPSNRERAIEQLLGRAAARSAVSVDAARCVDPEQLAAWAEGVLPADTSASIETHLAGCDRCQAILAVFAASEPPQAVSVPSWRRWSLRVLVPAAAASVVVLAWVAMTREPAPDPEMTMARVESFEAGAPVAPPAPAPAPADAPVQAPTPSSETADAGSAGNSAADSPKARPSGRASSAALPAPPSAAATALPPARQESATPTGVPAPAPRESAVADTGVADDAAASRAAFAPPPPPPPAPGFAAPVSAATAAAPQAAARTAGAANALPQALALPLSIEFGPPSGPLRWRITDRGRVERSSDAGATWTAVPLDASLFITGGAAPAPEICWLVDRAGTVLLSVDGATFLRTGFDEAVSLVGVQAVDARRATVTTADGRTFMTADGGATWTR